MKGILPYAGCVGIVEAKIDRSCAGDHSSVIEPYSLVIHPFHYLSSLINPTINWLGLILIYIWLCVSLLFPFSLWKSCLAREWQLCLDIDENNWTMVGWNVATT